LSPYLFAKSTFRLDSIKRRIETFNQICFHFGILSFRLDSIKRRIETRYLHVIISRLPPIRLDSIKRRIETRHTDQERENSQSLSDLIPLKEGLKHFANKPGVVFFATFRLDSIKRRIKTSLKGCYWTDG